MTFRSKKRVNEQTLYILAKDTDGTYKQFNKSLYNYTQTCKKRSHDVENVVK